MKVVLICKEDIVDINMETGNIHRSFLNHSIGHKDDDADAFGVRVFKDHVPVDLSGASCQAVFMAPDGTNIALTSYGTVNGNVAYVTLPQACYDIEGQFCLAIKLVGNGMTITVRIVDGIVEKTGTSGAVAPTDSVPTYQEIIAQFDEMVEATSAANECTAEIFDATKAYSAGDLLINDGELYRLTADHAENVTWANTSKVKTRFSDELGAVNDKIGNTALPTTAQTLTGAIAEHETDIVTVKNAIDYSTDSSKTAFYASNLYTYKFPFVAGKSYLIKIKLKTPNEWFTNTLINASTASEEYLYTKNISDNIIETITGSNYTISVREELDILFKPQYDAPLIVYYMGDNVIGHVITVEDVTEYNNACKKVHIPETGNGSSSTGFTSIKLFAGVQYFMDITNGSNDVVAFELTCSNSYTIDSDQTLERIFGGVISAGIENAKIPFILEHDFTLTVKNALATGVSDITYDIYASEETYAKYYEYIGDVSTLKGYKNVLLPLRTDIGQFYSIMGVNFEAGHTYILKFHSSEEITIDHISFSTFDGDASDYTFIENNVYDVYDFDGGTDYCYRFYCSLDAESLMLLIVDPDVSFEISIYEYKRMESGLFNKFINPVFSKRDTSDPTIWKGDDGYFYCIGSPWTDTNYGILRSSDLVEWENTGVYPFDSSVTDMFSTYTYGVWACQCIKIGGYWLMYIPLYAAGHQIIAVCKSRNPFGKFTFVSVLTDSIETGISDSIDPCVAIGEDNKIYMFFGSAGKIHRLLLTDDGLSAATGAVPVHVAGTSDPSDNREKIFEGSYLYFRNGYWYLFVSSGLFNTYNYKLKVGRSTSITGDFLDKAGNNMKAGNAETILSSSADYIYYGPGHNGEIFTDLSGKTYMLYHCHDKPSEYTFSHGSFTNIKSRMLFIQEIKWDSYGWPYFENGTVESSGKAPRL